MNLDTAQNKNPEKTLQSLYKSATKYFQVPDFDTFKEHMQNDQDKLLSFSRAMGGYYTMPNLDQLKADIGFIEKKKRRRHFWRRFTTSFISDFNRLYNRICRR